MGAPKLTPKDLINLYKNGGDKTETNLQDKRYVEALKIRLNQILQDPKKVKHAALIIELMMRENPKKK